MLAGVGLDWGAKVEAVKWEQGKIRHRKEMEGENTL